MQKIVPAPRALENIRIVLVGTLYSGNVGSVCRAMANMGLRQLTLVAPQLCDNWDDATRFAVHADDILNNRRTCATLAEAVADCVAVAGTTARGGLYRQHVRTPREVAPDLLACAHDGPVAIVFGREDKGLTNDEIAQCTHLIRIPVDEGYTSINLAQAALICCYELFTATDTYHAPSEKALPAVAAQKNTMIRMWRDMLLHIGFMEEQKADHMMQGIQRVFSRGVYTQDDCAIMMGVARQAKWAGHPPPKDSAQS